MKKRTLVFGVICGIACAVCVFAYTTIVYQDADAQQQEAVARYGGEQVDVLVATRDIYPGETLSRSNTVSKTWISSLLPEDAITDIQSVSGNQVASLILSGEVVSEARFKAASTEIQVPDGYVAVSVPAENVQAVGGALKVGSLVDVYATGSSTTCLGQNVLVLATNATGSDSNSKTEITWVTLAVNPSRAQEYVTASESMEIYFTLPAASDGKSSSSSNSSSNLSSSDTSKADSATSSESLSTSATKNENKSEG